MKANKITKTIKIMLLASLIVTLPGCSGTNSSSSDEALTSEVVEEKVLYSSEEELTKDVNKEEERSDEESLKIIQKTLDTETLKDFNPDYFSLKPFKVFKLEDKYKDEYYCSVWTQTKDYYIETKMYNHELKDGTFESYSSRRRIEDPKWLSFLDSKDVMRIKEWDFPENVKFFEPDYTLFEE